MEARAADRGYPISDPEVACFLAIVARLGQPKLVVELGTNIGYGAIVLGRAAGEQARVVTIEYQPDHRVKEARANIEAAGLSSRVEVRQGLAVEELQKLEGPIDLVYVDCVKEEYPRYLEIALPKLSARGVVIADNVLWRGTVAHEQAAPESETERTRALRAFNMAIASRPDLVRRRAPARRRRRLRGQDLTRALTSSGAARKDRALADEIEPGPPRASAMAPAARLCRSTTSSQWMDAPRAARW